MLEEIIRGTKPRMRLHAGVYDVDLLDTASGATASVGVVAIENPPPRLDAVRVTRTRGFPPRAGEAFGVHVSAQTQGVNFTIPGGAIYWDGAPLPTAEHDTALVATVPADLATAGDHSVQVITPQPGGGATDVMTIHVRP